MIFLVVKPLSRTTPQFLSLIVYRDIYLLLWPTAIQLNRQYFT